MGSCLFRLYIPHLYFSSSISLYLFISLYLLISQSIELNISLLTEFLPPWKTISHLSSISPISLYLKLYISPSLYLLIYLYLKLYISLSPSLKLNISLLTEFLPPWHTISHLSSISPISQYLKLYMLKCKLDSTKGGTFSNSAEKIISTFFPFLRVSFMSK